MTEENYKYRTGPLFFRNQFKGTGKLQIPVIPKFQIQSDDFNDLLLIGTVAVSTSMVSEHDNRQDQKEFFLQGYNEMLRRIEPEKIICYNTPFPEMQGDIVFVDYQLSSWKHLNNDSYAPSKYVKYICGEKPIPVASNLIIKSGYVVNENDGDYNSIIQTGMGSAYGGQWKPAKLEDERFLGEPGEIKISYDKKGIG